MAPRKQGQKKEFEGIKSLRVSSIFATNEAKLKSLREHFNVVHLVKNEMSEHVLANKHLLLTKDGRYELSSQHYKRFSTDELSAWETQQIFADVADMYVNSLKKRKSNQPFTVQNKFEVIRYKKDIKSKSGEAIARKGDVKTFEIKKKKTLLTKLASKLVSLDPKQFDSFVIMPPQPKENEAPDTFKKRFDKVVEENKYIESLKRNESLWQRLKAVVKHRQRNILSCLKLVEYSSGSYRKAVREGAKTAAKCSHVIKTDNAEYKYYYRFKIAKKEVIYIPLAINEKYHDFEHVNFDAAAYVSLNRKGHLNVGLQYTKGVSFVEHAPITGVVGLDLNVKDNFITVAYHNRSASYDYDRQLIKQLVDAHRDLDKRGYKNLCELDKARLKKLRGRAEAYFRSVISRVLNDFEANGITDIIMEDLHFSRKVGGGFSGEFGIKFNRLIRMLRLGSIKTWFREQANNRGMKVHFVNPAFSSQQCCKCHFVHRNNSAQQQFDCIICGHKEHADVNAAKVIRLRFIEDVLRKSLFEVEKGIVGRQLCGKKISKFAVKKVVDKLYKAA